MLAAAKFSTSEALTLDMRGVYRRQPSLASRLCAQAGFSNNTHHVSALSTPQTLPARAAQTAACVLCAVCSLLPVRCVCCALSPGINHGLPPQQGLAAVSAGRCAPPGLIFPCSPDPRAPPAPRPARACAGLRSRKGLREGALGQHSLAPLRGQYHISRRRCKTWR
jgi:hypothetical protein